MKKSFITISCILLCMLLLLGSVAFADSTTDTPIQIKYLSFKVGVHPEAASFKASIDEFNRVNEGKYEVIIEEGIPDIHEFTRKLTMLYAADDLPLFIDPLMTDKVFAEKIMNDGKCLDLAPFINADPEWKAALLPWSVEKQTNADGTIYSLPVSFYSAIGMIYNRELFEKAGMDTYPKTWDDLFEACEKLKTAGITPFALETADSCWSPTLFFNALICRTEEGRAFMRQELPTDFNIPAVIEAAADLQKLYEYATPDSVGSNYQATCSTFNAEQVAMQPDGAWRLMGLSTEGGAPEGLADKIDVKTFPGGLLLDHDSLAYFMALSNSYSEQETEAAIALLKFFSSDWYMHQQIRDRAAATPFFAPNEEDIAVMRPLEVKYCNLVASDEVKDLVPTYQVTWDNMTVNETLKENMPLLANGTYTPEEFAQVLTDSALYFKENVG